MKTCKICGKPGCNENWLSCKYCDGSEGYFDVDEVWFDCLHCDGMGGYFVCAECYDLAKKIEGET